MDENFTIAINMTVNATNSTGLSEDVESNDKYINSMINIICRPILITMGTIGMYPISYDLSFFGGGI